MRILALMPSWPYPLSDGISLRAFHFLQEASRQHQVHLIYRGQPRNDPQVAQLLAGSTNIPPSEIPPGSRLDRLVSMVRLGRVWPPELAVSNALTATQRTFAPEVLWVTHLMMVPSLPRKNRPPTVIDIIDDQVLHRLPQKQHGPPVLRTLVKYKRLLDVGLTQTACSLRCKVAAFAADRDAKAFRMWCPWLRCVAVPNGVDLEVFAPGGQADDRSPYVVFVGNYHHPPNTEAVEILARQVWPQVRRLEPSLRCLIVGPNLPPALAEEARSAGLEVTGWVEDVRPLVAGATAVLSPLVTGSGIKNKVLEAWAMGKAVVALPAGLAGLEEFAKDAALACATPQEMAQQIVDLLRNSGLRQSLERNARSVVERDFSWTTRARQFVQLLESAGGQDS